MVALLQSGKNKMDKMVVDMECMDRDLMKMLIQWDLSFVSTHLHRIIKQDLLLLLWMMEDILLFGRAMVKWMKTLIFLGRDMIKMETL